MGSPLSSLTPFPFVYLLFFYRHGTPYTIPSTEKKNENEKRKEMVPLSHTNSKFLSFYVALHDITLIHPKGASDQNIFFPLCDKFPYHLTYFNLRITLECLNTWSLKKVHIRTTSRNCGMNNTEHSGLHTPDKLYARKMVVHHFQ